MKKTIFITALMTSLVLALSNSAFATEESSVATPKMTTSVSIPNYFVTYGFYHYDLQGTNSSNTRIYQFDASAVDMHLVTATWLYSPQWTLLAFVPYVKNMAETVYFPGSSYSFKTKDTTEGLSDIRLMAATQIAASGNNSLKGDISVTLPTGSVDEHFTSNPSQRASYNMQLGSGTPDLIAGTTYDYALPSWITSVRGQATVRGGRNSNGWALGNEFVAGVTSKYHVVKYFDMGVAANYKARDQVQGRDNKYEIANNLPQGNGHQYYYAPQINWDTQIIANLNSPAFHGMTASLEGGVPFWRGAINKDDIRLDMPYWVSASVTGSF